MADVLHQVGHWQEAETAFREAEELQRSRQPTIPMLYALQGFLYCDLLLDKEEYGEVIHRIALSMKLAAQKGWLLELGLDYLSLGRAYLIQALQNTTRDFTQAANNLGLAVDTLRQSGVLDYLCMGLLIRVKLFIAQNKIDQAHSDLDEAMSIARRSSMGLHQADCHVEYARLYLAQGKKEKARESWLKAEEMIQRMGYHRRDKDLREIGEQLGEQADG